MHPIEWWDFVEHEALAQRNRIRFFLRGCEVSSWSTFNRYRELCKAQGWIPNLLAKAQQGWELRITPPTIHHATIGGFLAGGKYGIGSLKYGAMSDPGNIISATVVTLEKVRNLFLFDAQHCRNLG